METLNILENTSYESLILLILLNEGLLLNTEQPISGIFSKIYEIITRSSIFNIESNLSPLFYGLYDYVACPTIINDNDGQKIFNKKLASKDCGTLLRKITFELNDNKIEIGTLINTLNPSINTNLENSIAQIIIEILNDYSKVFLFDEENNSMSNNDCYKNLLFKHFELCDLYSEWSSIEENKIIIKKNGSKAGGKCMLTKNSKNIVRHLFIIHVIYNFFHSYVYSQSNFFQKGLKSGKFKKDEWTDFIDPLISESESDLVGELVKIAWEHDFTNTKNPKSKSYDPKKYTYPKFQGHFANLRDNGKLKVSSHSEYNIIKNYLIAAIRLIKHDFLCMVMIDRFTEKVIILSSSNKKEKSILYKGGFINASENTFIRKEYSTFEPYSLQITLDKKKIGIKAFLLAPELSALDTNGSMVLHNDWSTK